jgi:hypothetical protein
MAYLLVAGFIERRTNKIFLVFDTCSKHLPLTFGQRLDGYASFRWIIRLSVGILGRRLPHRRFLGRIRRYFRGWPLGRKRSLRRRVRLLDGWLVGRKWRLFHRRFRGIIKP